MSRFRTQIAPTTLDGRPERLELTAEEVERLAEILERSSPPPAVLRETLSRLADPRRQPPRLHWRESAI